MKTENNFRNAEERTFLMEKIIIKSGRSEGYKSFVRFLTAMGVLLSIATVIFVIVMTSVNYMPGINILLILPVFIIILIFIIKDGLKAEIYVTNKRVYLQRSPKRRIDLPVDLISSVGVWFFKRIIVTSSLGKISIAHIGKHAEIHEAITQLLIKRQSGTATFDANAKSVDTSFKTVSTETPAPAKSPAPAKAHEQVKKAVTPDMARESEASSKETVSNGNYTKYIDQNLNVAMMADREQIADVELPDDITTIESFAFVGDVNLESIQIPNSVTSIGDEVFFYCENLTDIIFNGTKIQWNAIKKGDNWDKGTGNYTVHCTDGDITK